MSQKKKGIFTVFCFVLYQSDQTYS